jgi:hypothetical protein
MSEPSVISPRFTFDTQRFEAELSRLPEKMAQAILRKAIRLTLRTTEVMAKAQYLARHTSRFNRPHVHEHFFQAAKAQRRGDGFVVSGAMGVRKSKMAGDKTQKGKWKTYFNDLPGWRFHFIERKARILPAIANQTAGLLEQSMLIAISTELRKARLA